ncbi:P-loop containing nucleoside triphosphate hydrolase protein [Pluteus cervinus]|uniref:P-loop containing nucleoside triphosphate hydrolase protein n=1 Tax=Pluteus cervinus TaxID=181527 RepID=A0ACD3B1X5_9AGAR|nr:P-loop containing nucleoside triphosphate hydrolase protein [Pluteus cervinus]
MANPNRNKRLESHYWAVIKGEKVINNLQNAQLFLEGVRNQKDTERCMSDLVTGAGNGTTALGSAMRYDTSPGFMNGFAYPILTYLRLNSHGGTLLHQVIDQIVDPPHFLNAFRGAFLQRALDQDNQLNFAWLFCQLIYTGSSSYFDQLEQHNLLSMFLSSKISGVRTQGDEVQRLVNSRNGVSAALPPGEPHPGGRHDNDKEDYRTISILPTASEITSAEEPFLRQAQSINHIQDGRINAHLDNQFRLLRQDMLHEMKDELKLLRTPQAKQGRTPRGMKLKGLTPEGLYYGPEKRHVKWGIAFRCSTDLPLFKKETNEQKRKAQLKDHPQVLKHGSVVSLLIDGEVVSFPVLHRDEDLLVQSPAIVVLQFEGRASITLTLSRMKVAHDISLIVTDTPFFAYEPVLKALQDIRTLPLDQELLHYVETTPQLPPRLSRIAMEIHSKVWADPDSDLQPILATASPGPIQLDESQTESLLSGLTKNVSLIQGPPGTGKSFIGSLLTKVLHDNTDDRILIVCYTNHALDDVLDHLLKIGIPSDTMVRLGALRKVDPKIEALSIFKQQRTYKWKKSDWTMINFCQQNIQSSLSELDTKFRHYATYTATDQELLDYLEFEEPHFHAAFLLPASSDGMALVGKNGRAISPTYLIHQWMMGWDAGIFRSRPSIAESPVWELSKPERLRISGEWKKTLFAEVIEECCDKSERYNRHIDDLARKRGEEVVELLKQRRIIACTTTAAAKYTKDIQAATPGIVLVEEAGEILESHVLTALGEKAKKLILIGDHKQLRPKINNYDLSVETELGFDLDVSLFERLILNGYRHSTLQKQHRMRPKISALIRELTYENLKDAPSTEGRQNLRGVRDNIVFINHDVPEDEDPRIRDRMDSMSAASKQNKHEVDMVLKIVRYLAQQGYGTEEMVVLTPYLGQLRLLKTTLQGQQGIDPILSDLDSFDLIRAGLLSPAAAKVSKKTLRLATIDNYQGEESKIVIVSLTRSGGKIGFMKSPERLNVLLSRARDALIMIGNAETFEKTGEPWVKLLQLLKKGGHITTGLPVRCQQHPTREAVLTSPQDFDAQCPDGGCDEPCGTMLNCGVHKCPSKCHQISDHSKMTCEAPVEDQCSKGHPLVWECHAGRPFCKKCEQEQKRDEKRKADRIAQEAKREAERLRHAKELDEIEDELQNIREAQQNAHITKQREDVLKQKKKDLEALKAQAAQPKEPRTPRPSASSGSPPRPSSSSSSVSPASPRSLSPSTLPTSLAAPTTPTPMLPSPSRNQVQARPPVAKKKAQKPITPKLSQAEADWKRRKEIEGDSNEAVDEVMEMTGLEDVKQKILDIKDKIDVVIRQGTDMKSERFNVAFLGNPGTGKTTVARLYAKFLASVQALPGSYFRETTGSRLAEGGISFARKEVVEKVLNAGGGTIFIDEAYQLASDHNPQGRQVLDFLLAEMENHVGTLVFILAGYNREMERFFEHNPGIPSRVPLRMQFNDYSDEELLSMFGTLIAKKFKKRMKVEDGVDGLYARVAIKRLGRGRGRPGFGNARALQNVVQKMTDRQAARLAQERRSGLQPDDLLLTKEDLIGLEPSKALADNASWKELQKLIGLKAVKDNVLTMFNTISTNYWRELQEEEPLAVSLNRVFLGSPGTGKTTVAKLYGQILSDLSLLSSGEVVVKNPADFIGAALGQSEQYTKAILAATVGKVLVIDEAYMLYGGSSSNGGQGQDSYKTAVIDTIVAEVQNVPGDDRCVLLLGYKTQMEDMFQNVNPGLARRFKVEDAFQFDDFTKDELMQVLKMKLDGQHLEATDLAIEVALDVLERRKRRPNFGNAGEVENLIGEAKIRQQARQAHLPPQQRARIVFNPEDFDPEFNRGENASINLEKLFEGIVGHEDIQQRLMKYQRIALAARKRNRPIGDQIPTSFVFKGPPGTGKTTVARKMGQVYYDLGFLASAEVVEKSASDLVAQYVGQTGPKTKKLMESALGRVLFIDEAYRLGEGHFAQEAIDELVALLTHPTFHQKIVVILAGYTNDMDRLLSRNSGLSSRFSEQVMFPPMEPEGCLELLLKRLEEQDVRCASLENRASGLYQMMKGLLQQLVLLENWGNARDVQTLAREIAGEALARDTGLLTASLAVDDKVVIRCTVSMLARLSAQSGVQPSPHSRPTQEASQSLPPQGQSNITTSTEIQKRVASPPPADQGHDYDDDDGRDAGVSDQVWQQLQKDWAMAEEADRRAQEELVQMRRRLEEEQARHRMFLRQIENMEKQKREQARLRELERIRALEAEMERKRKAEEERRKKEAEAQAKLRRLGVCVAGFQWIKQSGGYRCAGGSHFVTDGQLSRS